LGSILGDFSQTFLVTLLGSALLEKIFYCLLSLTYHTKLQCILSYKGRCKT
jgi:hypothetical protein